MAQLSPSLFSFFPISCCSHSLSFTCSVCYIIVISFLCILCDLCFYTSWVFPTGCEKLWCFFLYCQAQPQLQPSWAELVIISAFPATHPTTHPEKSKTIQIQHNLQNKSCFYQWVGPNFTQKYTFFAFFGLNPTCNGAYLTLI